MNIEDLPKKIQELEDRIRKLESGQLYPYYIYPVPGYQTYPYAGCPASLPDNVPIVTT